MCLLLCGSPRWRSALIGAVSCAVCLALLLACATFRAEIGAHLAHMEGREGCNNIGGREKRMAPAPKWSGPPYRYWQSGYGIVVVVVIVVVVDYDLAV